MDQHSEYATDATTELHVVKTLPHVPTHGRLQYKSSSKLVYSVARVSLVTLSKYLG